MTTAAWDVTGRCNLHCAHCAVADIYDHDGQSIGPEVTSEEGLVILRRLREAGCRHLRLAGGEPLMRRDITDLAAAAHQMGFTRIVIVTNGTGLTSRLADALLDAGVNEIVVSLEGATAQTHDQVRGNGTYIRAIKGLETMLERRPTDSQLKIAAQLTLSRPNQREIAMMVNWVGQMKLDYLSITILQLVGNARRNAEHWLPSVIEAMDARESALQAAACYPNLGIEIFGRPRSLAYFNERFGRNLPITIPSCAIVNNYQVLYTRPDGSTSPCGALHLGETSILPNQETSASVENCCLQMQSLPSILASPRFDPVKRLVKQAIEERWQDEFIPCARCCYRPACQLCPLFLREQKDKMVRECLLALQRLSQWRKTQNSLSIVVGEERQLCV